MQNSPSFARTDIVGGNSAGILRITLVAWLRYFFVDLASVAELYGVAQQVYGHLNEVMVNQGYFQLL